MTPLGNYLGSWFYFLEAVLIPISVGDSVNDREVIDCEITQMGILKE